MMRKFIAALVAAAIMALMVGPVAYAQEIEGNATNVAGNVNTGDQSNTSTQDNHNNTATATTGNGPSGDATASNDNVSSQSNVIKQKTKAKQKAVARGED